MVETIPHAELLKRLSDSMMKKAVDFDHETWESQMLYAILVMVYEQKITNELLRDQMEKLDEIYMGGH
jgi:hypothetical protein